jgi:predicted ATPase/class 3 adenylate cyclase
MIGAVEDLPDGVVTFAFTDVEGSTGHWEEAPDAMLEALAILDHLVDAATTGGDGTVVKPRGEGDSHFLVFESASAAVAAIARLQRDLAGTEWPTTRPLKVRAALHSGTAEIMGGDYYGPVVNRTARLRGIAHGGQTVLSRSTRELVADSALGDVSIEDMGVQRLRGLARPEHVFQLNVDGLEQSFPPFASPRGAPGNLPEQLTAFIGRGRELESASSLLRETRLLTILAPGGAGKTRLSIEVASNVAHEFPDGAYFIALADIGSSDEIVQAVAEALGLGLSADEDLQVQLLNYLATKRQLLVFDNFEHVTDGAVIVSEILSRAREVRIIVTSRERLGLRSETVMSIAGLETTWVDPDAALRASGVRLFVDAAHRANPGFELTGEDLDDLSAILSLVDGMPLAILLAASWADVLSVGGILEEISKSFDFLETELGDVPDRHRSVRAVFDTSWGMLGDDDRSTFARLSVFRGGFTRDAAAGVAGASIRGLAGLVAKSLVVADVESGRYTIHEMLRQFAEAELRSDPSEYEQVRNRHADFYSAAVDDVADLLASADQVRLAAAIEADLDNIRSAWRRALDVGAGSAGLSLLRGIYWVYEWRGWYQSAIVFLSEALDVLDRRHTGHAREGLVAMAMAVRGWFQTLVGQAEVGLTACIEAESVLPDSTRPIDRWILQQCLAIGYGYTGAVGDLIRSTAQAMDMASTMQDDFYRIGMSNWRSFAAVIDGDLATARELLPDALRFFEMRGDRYFATWNLWLQGLVALAEQRPLDAIDFFTRQVTSAEELGYLRGRVVAFEGLGDANGAAGRPAEAEIAYVESLVTADQMGMVPDILGLMTRIGEIWAASDRGTDAVKLLSTVCSEPLSDQLTFRFTSPIRDTATRVLAQLADELEPPVYQDAVTAGRAITWDVAAKELMDTLDGG